MILERRNLCKKKDRFYSLKFHHFTFYQIRIEMYNWARASYICWFLLIWARASYIYVGSSELAAKRKILQPQTIHSGRAGWGSKHTIFVISVRLNVSNATSCG